MEQEIEAFWKMLDNSQFVKTTDSITGEVEVHPEAIVDMEATVRINGEFDKEAINDWLYEHLKDNS
jgi:broad-specificity NMP kinase